ncbi:hypothetical protein SISSUDRAFT_646417 [Sistotremastrum suecicum HHB10207 ss-3]|uniref:Uncharacterized protein n=1 Tax=Sistotremastrum suecicum HHB10207 ss-3 TaxID=1314776 RepID=A0A166EAF8_9AGAM|nr:hypothetical protein SISSUDRAFT_646417 [Sistotremastrum suecicum HHB10207 ss-3]
MVPSTSCLLPSPPLRPFLGYGLLFAARTRGNGFSMDGWFRQKGYCCGRGYEVRLDVGRVVHYYYEKGRFAADHSAHGGEGSSLILYRVVFDAVHSFRAPVACHIILSILAR